MVEYIECGHKIEWRWKSVGNDGAFCAECQRVYPIKTRAFLDVSCDSHLGVCPSPFVLAVREIKVLKKRVAALQAEVEA
jgi:hypothetical protein